MSFLKLVTELMKSGKSEAEIAKELEFRSTTAFRAYKAAKMADKTRRQIGRARTMKLAGYSNIEIARAMGIDETFVRRILSKDEPSQENRPL